MTWAELHGALRSRGLIAADDAPRAEAVAREVSGIAYDSRVVKPGDVFVALKGLHADGTAFARQAIDRGAAAVVSEQAAPAGVRVPWAIVGDARLALALLATTFYRDPSHDMRVVGITGTNGKTTTAYLVASIFEAAGVKCGVLGTVAYRIGDDVREATRTTPEAPDVQALLREMVDRGCGACAMEVSSHALALCRVDGMTFAAAVFTNLTRDHLDFHADMDEYFRAKRRLFEMLPRSAPSVLNVDDPRGASLLDAGGRPMTYGINRPADVSPGRLSYSLDGLQFDVATPRDTLHVRSKLIGKPNVYNILAAITTATALEIPSEAIAQGLAALDAVPGRFQMVSGPGDDVTVVVDYAHTDDALRNLLETARPLAHGRLITVFGCGGDRDRTKRPLMGAVAGRLSDVIVITSDNPRSEDPVRIIEEIQRGITPDTRREKQSLLTIVDRKQAIVRAIEIARPNDLVLVAGKGHEKYQVIGDRTLPFDDVAVAREALAKRRTNSGVL
ncbi:MAG TPA: UDP-N-acetylmuramoyl-L-alanyl-D-glutamate--2,6-diaminopimelate ligase [Vicinamibacterales bacterium]|nr:UDP-N-acetylmuramoyl-L-alanyl-D-glutamate--2,6-diaminopimelate ligase [Vicinamibacterales bacterium]